MRLLIIADPGVQLTELGVVLAHLGHVPDTPEHQDRVAEEEPAEGAGWGLEQLAEIQRVLRPSPGHQVNKEQRGTTRLLQNIGWILRVAELLQLHALVGVTCESIAVQVFVRVRLLGQVVHLHDLVDIALDTLTQFFRSFH